MKKLLVLGCAVIAVAMLGLGVAGAKPVWKKDLGVANCAACHLEDKKAANPDNKLWAVGKDHAAKMKEGKGAFAGKTVCADCHKGATKPPK
jgi:mono/diheme cytochrome c family protein